MPMPCSDHAVLLKTTAQHGRRETACGLATCLPSASSGYHAEFHEDCYQKHTNPPHNDPYLRLYRVIAAHCKKVDLLNCLTSSSDISGYHADFYEEHGTVGVGQVRGMACVN
jgi:hypothetical protein